MSEPEPLLTDLAAKVRAAQASLLAVIETRPDEWWDPAKLRKKAQNGWGGDVMMFALTDLVNGERLMLDDRLWVKLRSN